VEQASAGCLSSAQHEINLVNNHVRLISNRSLKAIAGQKLEKLGVFSAQPHQLGSVIHLIDDRDKQFGSLKLCLPTLLTLRKSEHNSLLLLIP
jgi:hypothetical protein